MLGQWDKWIVDQPSDVRSIIFFHDFLQNSFQKSFQFIFFFYIYKITKIKTKSFDCPKSINLGQSKLLIIKNNTWNIRLLVEDLFVPSSKQPSVIYCRLTDFKLSTGSPPHTRFFETLTKPCKQKIMLLEEWFSSKTPKWDSSNFQTPLFPANILSNS